MSFPPTRTSLLFVLGVLLGFVPPSSSQEPIVLFDGQSLAQWDVIGCEATIQDGALLLQAGNGLVQTKRKYADFVLDFEWKALHREMWDSGVYFRYSEVPAGRPWPKQYQVNLRKGMEGELVGFQEAVNRVPVTPHAWNRFELTLQGQTASLKVDGKAAWEVSGIAERSGYIALQAEVPGGGQFLFRNIRVRELAP